MKPIRLFIYSAGGILLAAALIRFVIAAGNAPVLSLPEPMLGIPLRYAVVMVGAFELLVALICLFGKKGGGQIVLLAWLATNFMVYQIGLLAVHCNPQVACIGSFTDPLHLARGVTGALIEFMTLFLLMGSYTALLWPWLAKIVLAVWPRHRAIDLLKMSCPGCGTHIRFLAQNLGQAIHCPHCQTVITLRKPDLLKMTCFFCKGHIEFPTHAIGEKVSCPHCKMGITLKEPT